MFSIAAGVNSLMSVFLSLVVSYTYRLTQVGCVVLVPMLGSTVASLTTYGTPPAYISMSTYFVRYSDHVPESKVYSSILAARQAGFVELDESARYEKSWRVDCTAPPP